MQTITTIGLDIAKSVFQVHGVDADGQVVIRRKLKRRYVLAFFQKLPACLVGIEACATSHHWSRQLQALGHKVRLMPPVYVKPYVKRQKNDAADAEAICEAVTRANMRFVETKTVEQQGCLMLHRTRHLFIREQTAVINVIRAHLAEFGIVAPVGRKGVEELLRVIADPADKRIPEIARACLAALGTQLQRLKEQLLEFDRMIMAWHRSDETSRRLDEAPGIGPMLATAVVATVADPKAFRSGRNFSAWVGLVPKQHSSGGKDRLGHISKQGDRYLRGLFVAGALAVIRYAKIYGTRHRPWLTALLARRPTKVAAIALANKIARMAWAMMVKVNVTRNPSRLRRKRDRVGHPARCEGWEGEQHVMQSRSIWRSGQPTYPHALSNAGFRLGPDPRRALWPAARCAAQKGRTHGRTDQCCCICEESSCQLGAVHTRG